MQYLADDIPTDSSKGKGYILLIGYRAANSTRETRKVLYDYSTNINCSKKFPICSTFVKPPNLAEHVVVRIFLPNTANLIFCLDIL